MKQKMLIYLLAFIAFCSFSTLQAQGWDKTFTSLLGDTTSASSVTEAHDKGLVFSGARTIDKDFRGYSNFAPFVVKTNKDGGIVWQYNPTNLKLSVDTTKIFTLRDSSFLFFGTESYRNNVGSDTFPRFRLLSVKLDKNGNELWRKSNSTLTFLDAALSLDSTYLFVSGFSNVVNGSKLLKISISGDSLWSKDYFERYFYKMIIGGDGMIYASVDNRSNTPDTILYGRGIWKLDLIGNRIWVKSTNFYFGRIKRAKDGRIILNTLAKIDYNGQTIYKRNGNRPKTYEFTEGKNDSDLRFLSCDNLSLPTDYTNVYFVRSDSLSNTITQRFFDVDIPFHYSVFKDFITTSDGGFVGVGFIDYSSNPYNEFSKRRARLVKFSADGYVYANVLKGKTYIDSIANCRLDATESGYPNRLISVEKNSEPRWVITDSLGNYEMQLDTGNYVVKTILPNQNWRLCTPSVSKQISGLNSVDTANFALQAAFYCPQMRISTTTPGLRRCFDNNYYQIRYTNEGTVAAQNAFITLKLDSLLDYVGASRPLSSRTGQTLRFNLGTVPIGFDDQFSVQFRVKCGDSTQIGRSLCTEARIFPDTVCIPAANWSGANIVVSGRCDRDSVRFLIQNIGTGASSNLRRQIVEDEIVFLNGTINVPASGSRAVSVPANGKTWRLTMDQEPNNPLANRPTVVIEGCRNAPNLPISTGFVNQFPTDDGSPTIDNVCAQIVGAFDPNDKEGLPFGYKSAHFIDQNQPIDYRIRFQNTGNDTAFTVVLRDTLSDFLDIASIKIGASSHKFTWSIEGRNVLIFRFDNIKLVDSFRNVAASQGFMSFKINQKKDVALGSKINNQADIYFDYNAPIRTNKTLHTIGKDFIISALQTISPLANVKINVFPNPFSAEATIEITGFEKRGPLSIKSNFSLFDAVGRQLRSEKMEGNTHLFKRQDLTTGIYFFRIENDGQLVGTGKFLIQ